MRASSGELVRVQKNLFLLFHPPSVPHHVEIDHLLSLSSRGGLPSFNKEPFVESFPIPLFSLPFSFPCRPAIDSALFCSDIFFVFGVATGVSAPFFPFSLTQQCDPPTLS